MRISSVWAIFLLSFFLSLLIYYPTIEAKLVFDFVDFIRSYHETGWNIYFPETQHLSPYFVSKVVVTGLYRLFGFNNWRWHLFTCFLLALNNALLFYIVKRIAQKIFHSAYVEIAFFSALLFLLVPYHTETIVWAGALNYLVVGFFVLAGLSFTVRYVETEKTIFLLPITLTFLLGSFSHEWGLFGIVAALLLVFFLLPGDEKISAKTIWFFISVLIVPILYLFNQWKSGAWIAHYGAEVHLNFEWREMTVAFYKYIFKIVFLSGFWPYEWQEHVFQFMANHSVNNVLFVLAAFAVVRSLWQITFRRNAGAVSAMFFLLFVIFVFPVLNLYFPNWTKIMADRYCYLTSAFLLTALVVFSFYVFGKRAKWILIPYAILSAYFLSINVSSWHNAGKIISSLEKDFRWKHNEQVYFLNMPDNFNGAYMLRSTFTSGVAAREIKNGIHYPRKNNMTDVAAYNLFLSSDSVLVTKIDSVTLRVQLSNPDAWWWRFGAGAESYETDALKVDLDNASSSYRVVFKNKKRDDVFVYQANGKWVEVSDF